MLDEAHPGLDEERHAVPPGVVYVERGGEESRRQRGQILPMPRRRVDFVLPQHDIAELQLSDGLEDLDLK